MKKNMKTFCLVVLTVLIGVSSASAEGTWTNYKNSSYIDDIAVEGDYIWCATTDGVVRWNKQDGTYSKYTTTDGLVYDYVISTAVDTDNVKWFGTQHGVSSFDGTIWTTYIVYDELADNAVWSIAVDIDNVKWFGTKRGGVSSFDGTTWTTYTTEDGLASVDVRAIVVDHDNIKWFGTWEGGVSSFDGAIWTTYTTEDGLVNNFVHAIAIDTDDVKWFGTDGGGVSSFENGPVSVENDLDIPSLMDIRGNFPNPFNSQTTIQYELPIPSKVTITIFNVVGQQVQVHDTGTKERGTEVILEDKVILSFQGEEIELR